TLLESRALNRLHRLRLRRRSAGDGRRALGQRPLVEWLVAAYLLGNPRLNGLQLQRAARVQVEKAFCASLYFRSVLHAEVAFGVEIGVHYPSGFLPLEVDPQDALSETSVKDAHVKEDVAAEHDDELAVLNPGGGLVGGHVERFGVARHVANDAQQLLSVGRRPSGRQCDDEHRSEKSMRL